MAGEPDRPNFEALLTALAEAKAALLAAEAEATEELIHAKAACREDPTDENRERKARAVDNIQTLRALVREGRAKGPGATLAGDVFLSPEQNEG